MPNANNASDELGGMKKTAVLLLTLGDKFAAEVFKRMERQEIAQISKAIVDIDVVPKEQVEEVLREFHYSMISGREEVRGGQETVKRMLLKNLDSDTSKYVIDTLGLESGSVPFRDIANISPRFLAQILRNEHPQTLALLLGHLEPEQAAGLLQNLPSGVHTEILMRLAHLEAVSDEMLMAVDKVLQSQVIAMGGKEGRKVGGVQSVAEILNSCDRAVEEEILAEIEEEAAQMA